jgi:hypothetical protein
MAQYKVIQDIEAEDKLVGPLTLRQFIYAGISAVCLYICFLAFTKGIPFLMVFFLPIAAMTGFFAFPWKGEQPTEIWALARARFMLKPRVRVWDQDGAKDLVTIIAPKKIAVRRSTKEDMTQTEVRSRLRALADTIDSRGWATRNAAYGAYNQQWNRPVVATPGVDNSLSAMIPNDDMFDDKNTVAQNFDSMLNKSQSAQRERVMQQMSQAQNPLLQQNAPQPQYAVQQQAMQPQYNYAMPQLPTPVMPDDQQAMMQARTPDPAMYPAPATYQAATAPAPAMPQPAAPTQPPADYWFASGPAYPANPAPVQLQQQSTQDIGQDTGAYRVESDAPLAIAATPTAAETSMGQDIQQKQAAIAINYGHMRVLQPTPDPYTQNAGGAPINYQDSTPFQQPIYSQQPTLPTPMATPAQSVTRTPDPAILDLANNDDLDIATIARQAKREIDKSPDEVEIRLH